MKYGEQFEKESVPGWSLHNIDYNSLKHYIKVHTTRDQATAIAIPGHRDTALSRFENELFAELCRQHDRVDLFVTSKVDEISRRLQHLSNRIHQLVLRCATSPQDHMSFKRRRKFVQYDQALFQCGYDLHALQRFVNAQIIAFRKILKKYRKWTGSSTLGSRFKETVLSNPKSFTRRDLSHLQAKYNELLATLTAATPADLGISLSSTDTDVHSRRSSRQPSPPTVATANARHQAQQQQQQQRQREHPTATEGYWNEYDHGSEGGDFERDPDDGYAIYVDPNEEHIFPGLATLTAILTMPVKKVKALLGNGAGIRAEHGPLLPTHSTNSYGSMSQESYSVHLPGGSLTETEAEDDSETLYRIARRDKVSRRGSYGYASSDEFPDGPEAHYDGSLSSDELHMLRSRERMLFWGIIGSFAGSVILLGIAAVLILTGRHRWRAEVDAGVTIGVVASLACACAGLGMTFTRQNKLGWLNRLAAWATFTTVCVLNGILLVLVVGNTV